MRHSNLPINSTSVNLNGAPCRTNYGLYTNTKELDVLALYLEWAAGEAKLRHKLANFVFPV